MREGRKEEASKVKQTTNKAKQHSTPQGSHMYTELGVGELTCSGDDGNVLEQRSAQLNSSQANPTSSLEQCTASTCREIKMYNVHHVYVCTIHLHLQ